MDEHIEISTLSEGARSKRHRDMQRLKLCKVLNEILIKEEQA